MLWKYLFTFFSRLLGLKGHQPPTPRVTLPPPIHQALHISPLNCFSHFSVPKSGSDLWPVSELLTTECIHSLPLDIAKVSICSVAGLNQL